MLLLPCVVASLLPQQPAASAPPLGRAAAPAAHALPLAQPLRRRVTPSMGGRRKRGEDGEDDGQAIFAPWRPGDTASGVDVPENSKRLFMLLLALPALLQIAAIATYNPSADELRAEQERRAMRLRGGALAAPAGARARRPRRAENAPGSLYVDDSCIDCDTCRWMAPGTYGRAAGQSYVRRQPSDDGEVADALAAVVACPTGSIRLESSDPRIRDVRFPRPIDAALPHVYHRGYHCAASFGATPYLLLARRDDGAPCNVMIDCPRCKLITTHYYSLPHVM